MKISDTYYFDAGQQIVWNVLMNPDAIAKAIPGVDRLIPIEGETTAWKATAKIGIAAVSGTYTGSVRMTELVPPDQYRLTVNGEGQASIINGSALLTLSFDAEKNKTLVSWNADANVAGRLAGVGQRLIAVAATMLAKQFFRSLARQLPGTDAPLELEKEEKGSADSSASP
ncbi:MAG: SRPBCC family protein [Aggregatilineales bacterium]